jgi:hypothetical protein
LNHRFDEELVDIAAAILVRGAVALVYKVLEAQSLVQFQRMLRFPTILAQLCDFISLCCSSNKD